MTYEEAKIQIQAIPEKIWDQLSEPDREAMEMAFSALEKQDSKTRRKTLVNVNKGQDAYSVIGNYISNHITAIEDMIAVIRIDGCITNELYMVDMETDGYFYWENDWWEGEEDVALIDFFPVSEAERPQELSKNSAEHEKKNGDLQPTCNQLATDTISRQDAIDEIRKCRFVVDAIEKIIGLPSAQPEPLVNESRTLVNDLVEEIETWNRRAGEAEWM